MKVAAFVHGYPPFHNAGAEWMLHQMLQGWQKMGATVYVVLVAPFLPSSITGWEFEGIPVYCHDVGKLWHADVVVTHLDHTGDAEQFCQTANVPLVHLVHNELTLRPITSGGLLPKGGSAARLVIANSDWLHDDLSSWWDSTPIITCHPPVPVGRYKTERTDDPEGVSMMNLSHGKGAMLAFEVATRLPQIPFIFVQGAYGGQMTPPKREHISHWATQEDAREVYSKSRVVMMPSMYESWGRVSIEAACSGIPCVANPTVGLREALGACGVYPSAYTVDAWVESVTYAYEHAEELGAAALKRAKALERSTNKELKAALVAIEAAVKGG